VATEALNSGAIVAGDRLVQDQSQSNVIVQRPVRIGGASAFWGDSSVGPIQLAQKGQLDFMVFDYLAELTMSIMAAQKSKNPELGYATDFVTVAMKSIARQVASGEFKVISNAGGMNPIACAQALKTMLHSMGLDIVIAVVTGDDVLSHFATENGTGTGSTSTNKKRLTANAYLGAEPIKKALDEGAQVVITGRCVDSAVTLGAIAHWFDWNWSEASSTECALQLNQFAQASLAGHIIECGCQATGGLMTDWQTVPDWPNIGYPIIEFAADASFIVTKPLGTGGLISVASVGEQIVYEVHDPKNYLLPDVSCDFSNVNLEQIKLDKVRVVGAIGAQAPTQLKVSSTAMQGFRCNAQLTIVGIDAGIKAQRTAEAIFARFAAMLKLLQWPPLSRFGYEVLGNSPTSPEVVLTMAAAHIDKKALELFAREIAPAGTSFSPGTTGASGRPTVAPLIEQISLMIDRELVQASVEIDSRQWDVSCSRILQSNEATAAVGQSADVQIAEAKLDNIKVADVHVTNANVIAANANTTDVIDWLEVRLIDIAYGRSGDKGDISNIGVIARSNAALQWLEINLSSEKVALFLAPWVKGKVTRYPWPGLSGFNFVCEQALDGGGMASLRNDPLGKGMAQRLLAMPLKVPRNLFS
jgi:Acyclic terpene utilisation family protein AtuA